MFDKRTSSAALMITTLLVLSGCGSNDVIPRNTTMVPNTGSRTARKPMDGIGTIPTNYVQPIPAPTVEPLPTDSPTPSGY